MKEINTFNHYISKTDIMSLLELQVLIGNFNVFLLLLVKQILLVPTVIKIEA